MIVNTLLLIVPPPGVVNHGSLFAVVGILRWGGFLDAATAGSVRGYAPAPGAFSQGPFQKSQENLETFRKESQSAKKIFEQFSHYTAPTKGYNNCGYGVYWVLADLGVHQTHPKYATKIMINALPLPPLEVLQEKFVYNPKTGELLHRGTNKRLKAGTVAGYSDKKGWLRVKIGDTHYRAHRIVWKMFYGEDPTVGLEIDHINRITTDNRIDNLRLVTRKENIANSSCVAKAAEKNSKPVIIVSPAGQESWFPSVKGAAIALNSSPSQISRVLRGIRNHYKGFTARYAEL